MSTQTQSAPTSAVRCRPPRAYWILLIFPGFLGALAALASQAPTKSGPPSPMETAVWEAIAGACLLLALGVAWWLARACVVADASGLRWRGVGPWKSARWEDVRDFYERSTRAGAESTTVSAVKTASGEVGVTSLWSGADALREQVELRAVHSLTHVWEALGTRAVDPWPRVFDYDTLENRWAPRLWLKLFLVYVVYVLVKPAMQLPAMAGLMGWATTLLTAGLYLLLVGSLGLIFLIPLAQYRAAGRRKAERITVSLGGIVFEDGSRRVEAVWADVTGYGMAYGKGAAVRYTVETRQGAFDFLANIRQTAVLRAVIQRYAAESADQEWCLRADPEALGGEAARWSGGAAGIGARVFHYRTRSYRAMLPLALCLTFGLLAVSAGLGLLPGASVAGEAWGAAVCAALYFGGWYAYRTCSIQADEEALTRVTPLGRHRLRWDQVENYFLTGEQSQGVVQGRGESLRFGSGIVGSEELKSEIVRRALGCGGKAWAQKAVADGPTTRGRGGPRRGRRGPGSSATG